MLLAPCDTERAACYFVDARPLATAGEPTWRMVQARGLLGQDGLCPVDESMGAPDLEIGLAAVIGDDLSRVTPREAASTVMGLAIFVDWFTRGNLEHASPGGTPKGVTAQLGPTLVSR